MNLFPTLQFNSKTHTYTIDNVQLKSVTQKISELKQPQDWDAIALKVSQKEGHEYQGKPVKWIRQQWKEKGCKAMRNGTIIHNYIEHRLKGTPYQIYTKDWKPEMSAWEKWWDYHKKYLIPVGIEMKIGDRILGLGGTIDCLFFDNRVEKYRIADWKTGSKFRQQNIFQTYVPPFDMLEECELNTYSFQTGIYQLILQRNSDLILDDPFLVWLKDDEEWEEFRVLDFKVQLSDWLVKDEF